MLWRGEIRTKLQCLHKIQIQRFAPPKKKKTLKFEFKILVFFFSSVIHWEATFFFLLPSSIVSSSTSLRISQNIITSKPFSYILSISKQPNTWEGGREGEACLVQGVIRDVKQRALRVRKKVPNTHFWKWEKEIFLFQFFLPGDRKWG